MAGQSQSVLCVFSDEQREEYAEEFATFQQRGVDIVFQSSPDDALDQIATLNPCLVFLGMTIGPVEGLELLAMLMQRYPRFDRKVVVLPDKGDPFPPVVQSRDAVTGRSNTEQIDFEQVPALVWESAAQKRSAPKAVAAPAKPAPPVAVATAGAPQLNEIAESLTGGFAATLTSSTIPDGRAVPVRSAPAKPAAPVAVSDLPTPELAELGASVTGRFAATLMSTSVPEGTAPTRTPAPRTPAPRTPAPRTPAPRTPAPVTAPTQVAAPAPMRTPAPARTPAPTAPAPIPAVLAATMPPPAKPAVAPLLAATPKTSPLSSAVAAWQNLPAKSKKTVLAGLGALLLLSTAIYAMTGGDDQPAPATAPAPTQTKTKTEAVQRPEPDRPKAREPGPDRPKAREPAPAATEPTPKARPEPAAEASEFVTLPLRFSQGRPEYEETDSNELATTLAKLRREIERRPDAQLEIGGHTSNEGNSEFNRTLGTRRAAFVRLLLKRRRFPMQRVVIKSYSASMSDHSDPDSNRRVTVRVVDE